MEISKLRHFAVAAEYKSLSTAAGKLGLGVPALSRSVKSLEESIHGKIFERTKQGLKLTELGSVLLEYAHSIIQEHDRAMYAINAITKQKSGVLRIGVVRYLTSFGLPQTLVKLVRRFPIAGLEVTDSSFEDLILKLTNVEVDVAIAILTTPLANKSLQFEPVVKSDLIFAASASHPLAKKDVVSLQDLRQSRCIVSNRPALIRAHYQLLRRGNENIEHHPLVVSSPTLTRNLLRSGDLYAICSRHDVTDDLKSGRIVELRRKVANSQLPIGFITRKSGVQSALLAAFLEEARLAFKEAEKALM